MKKKLLVVLLLAVCLSCLVGCIKYVSHYSALMLVTTNTSKSASISFSSLNGTKSFRLKSDGHLNYSAKLGEGSATVFYDTNGTKTELFSIKGGQEIQSSTIAVNPGAVYVIVQTDGKCQDGRFSFDVK